MAIIRRNGKQFFYAFWQFSTILLSDYMTHLFREHTPKANNFFSDDQWQESYSSALSAAVCEVLL